ncbi:hypothetical protein FPOAC2_01786 [Fusarium poae]
MIINREAELVNRYPLPGDNQVDNPDNKLKKGLGVHCMAKFKSLNMYEILDDMIIHSHDREDRTAKERPCSKPHENNMTSRQERYSKRTSRTLWSRREEKDPISK